MLVADVCGWLDDSKLVEAFAPLEPNTKEISLTDFIELPSLSEVDIMYAKAGKLVLGNGGLTESDVETLLSFATAPMVAIPLLLEFVESKPDMLAAADVRFFIEALVYQLGVHSEDTASATAELPFKEPIGTACGILFEEVKVDPEVIMCAAVRLSFVAAKLCANISFRNSLCDVLFFVLHLDWTLLSYCSAIIGEHDYKEDATIIWKRHSLHFISEVALPLLRFWLFQAEQGAAHAYVVNLSVFIALCEAAKLEGDENRTGQYVRFDDEGNKENLTAFVACSCYVVQWFDKARCNDRFHLPINRFFKEAQRLRPSLVKLCDTADMMQSKQKFLVKLLEASQAFALRQLTFSSAVQLNLLESSLWYSTSDNLCFTQCYLESEHPYSFDLESVAKVEIKDAPYLILSFDSRSSLGSKRDGAVLLIYTDKALTKEVLVRVFLLPLLSCLYYKVLYVKLHIFLLP
jgi:hypothetical protein